MIVLNYHFEDKDTVVFMHQGKKVIMNGCECFEEADLDKICEHYDVSAEQKELVIEALSEVEEFPMFDIEEIIKEYSPKKTYRAQLRRIFGKHCFD